ncbi:MAG: DEAD/DEAH box helicase [Candidatus Latescibacterota bacterium]|nr:MAG: DEAD/DEAH box helicase [Candidatus Latescibacterota bacterium]
MSLELFHPAVREWFASRFESPTVPQAQAWPSIHAAGHTLIAAPTGSGKTLAAFLAAIDSLVQQAQAGTLADETQVVYVSPLKALSNDIERNLQEPLAGIRAQLETRGDADAEVRVFVRTGDTPASQREAMVKRPPHLVVTTPESLYILLTSRRGREMLRTTRSVIVDEIHALVGSKRGSHLALTLERLEALCGRKLVRIGLSATQRPIDEVARFLVGRDNVSADERPECTIIDSGHARRLDLAIEVPGSPLEAVMSGEVWEEIYDRLAALITQHRTTLLFVNTRRLAERVTRHLSERLGPENVTSHHGSLSREHRLHAEQRLKQGHLQALVATASLELGIDIGDVDLVCQLGSTRSIATLLQRVGRSGHGVGRIPKGRLFPLSRDELVECAALVDAIRRGELDQLVIPEQPLDILAQQIVAAVACEEWREEALYTLVRRAHPYRDLSRDDFDAVVTMLANGFSTRRGRRSAHLHRDAVNGRLRARRGARLAAITCGGAIPDNADYQVVLDPTGTFIGSVNEDFAVESMPGDIFQLGNASWLIRRVEPGRVRVEDAKGQPPSIPFWLGEAPGRSVELSLAVSRLREELATRMASDAAAVIDPDRAGPDAASQGEALSLESCRWLVDEINLAPAAARQIVDYLAAAQAALGAMPTQERIVLERFFDETGGMQLVVHAPFGSRINRAWGLALRKRFCRKFNIELQAAATEDAIVISLGPTHSFALADVARYLNAATLRDVLVQALLAAPMFAVRWRWNSTRSLAVLRFSGGRRVPPQLTRIQSEDLLSVVFPDQVACAENLPGDREVPEHPLVQQTIRDCLEEAMDVERLESLLRAIAAGEIEVIARDVSEPSPLSQEILNARPYAFLDDAPLEERRTQAVLSRRWLDPETAADLGALDQAAIDRVREEIWPQVESYDELHDALVLYGFLTAAEGRSWQSQFEQLATEHRVTTLSIGGGDELRLWVAAERLPQFAALFPSARLEPHIAPPECARATQWSAETALVEIVRSRLEGLGPVTVHDLATSLGVPSARIDTALAALESEGFALRGRFTPGGATEEWCDRRLLARIHRYTLKRLRSEIEPVTPADYMRFLLQWQRVLPDAEAEGASAVAAVLEQLEGFEAAAAAWEAEILPARVADYDPAWLDSLCLSGRFVWTRLSPPKGRNGQGAERGTGRARTSGPVRTTPITFLPRQHVPAWRSATAEGADTPQRSPEARAVETLLHERGACFFDDIVRGSGLLHTQVESALGELVACGRVSADGFTGLRALLVPSDRRRPLRGGGKRRRALARFGVEDAGRWVLVQHGTAPEEGAAELASESVEHVARTLLRRYGVLFRRMIEREPAIPQWRDILRLLRRMEARGEIRGGRFVSSFTGEQFALPQAVETLRRVRRTPLDGQMLSVSAADALNLVGIVTPGERVPAHTRNRVLYRDGVPIAVRVAGEVRFLTQPPPGTEWEVRQALVRRRVPPQLRAYLRLA